ncbi:MAG: PIN domain-containing protein [Mesorhizobium sp.]|nr:PIN domain-containing protein [Mesorhizobium sp.]
MQGDRFFVDANVLLYLHDKRFPAKSAAVETWLRALASRRAAQTNLQVLNEVTNVLLKKPWYADARVVFSIVDEMARLGDAPISNAETALARSVHIQTSYSWWDCLLLASALELGCTHFLSEDLQDGQRIVAEGRKGLTIVDPFAHSPDQILLS